MPAVWSHGLCVPYPLEPTRPACGPPTAPLLTAATWLWLLRVLVSAPSSASSFYGVPTSCPWPAIPSTGGGPPPCTYLGAVGFLENPRARFLEMGLISRTALAPFSIWALRPVTRHSCPVQRVYTYRMAVPTSDWLQIISNTPNYSTLCIIGV